MGSNSQGLKNDLVHAFSDVEIMSILKAFEFPKWIRVNEVRTLWSFFSKRLLTSFFGRLILLLKERSRRQTTRKVDLATRFLIDWIQIQRLGLIGNLYEPIDSQSSDLLSWRGIRD